MKSPIHVNTFEKVPTKNTLMRSFFKKSLVDLEEVSSLKSPSLGFLIFNSTYPAIHPGPIKVSDIKGANKNEVMIDKG
ncbi:MAG: hypothetical protein ACOC40_02785 [Thermoplasmatota archaeon]